jgi:hypothetical protein
MKILIALVDMGQLPLPIITFTERGAASNQAEAGSGSEDDMTGLKWMLATAVLTTAISGSVFAESQRRDSRRDDGNYTVQRYDRDDERGQVYHRYVVQDRDRDNRVLLQRDRDRDYRAYHRRDSDDWNRR